MYAPVHGRAQHHRGIAESLLHPIGELEQRLRVGRVHHLGHHADAGHLARAAHERLRERAIVLSRALLRVPHLLLKLLHGGHQLVLLHLEHLGELRQLAGAAAE